MWVQSVNPNNKENYDRFVGHTPCCRVPCLAMRGHIPCAGSWRGGAQRFVSYLWYFKLFLVHPYSVTTRRTWTWQPGSTKAPLSLVGQKTRGVMAASRLAGTFGVRHAGVPIRGTGFESTADFATSLLRLIGRSVAGQRRRRSHGAWKSWRMVKIKRFTRNFNKDFHEQTWKYPF